MRKMMMSLALVAACFAACGEDPRDNRPLDGPYRVTATFTRQDCAEYFNKDTLVTADLLLAADGTYVLTLTDLVWLVSIRLDGLERGDGGAVDQELAWYSYFSWEDSTLKITGTVTPEALDLTLLDDATTCKTGLRLTGAPVPLGDTAELEGHYALKVESYGWHCDPAEEALEGSSIGDIDVQVAADGALNLLLGGGQTIRLTAPDADGNYSGPGTFEVFDGVIPWPYGIDVEGHFRPNDIAFSLELYELFQTTGDCAQFYEIAGAKRLPDLEAVDNDYRLRYRIEDGCSSGEDALIEFDDQASVVTQADGRVLMVDQIFTLLAPLEADGSFKSEGEELDWGYVYTIEGAIGPPLLDYVLTVDFLDYDGVTVFCTTKISASGRVRYVF